MREHQGPHQQGPHSESQASFCPASHPTEACPCVAGELTDFAALVTQPGFAGVRLPAAASSIARHLPHFQSVVAMTVSSAALISQTGHYNPPTFTGGPLQCPEDGITLRLHAPAIPTVVAADEIALASRPNSVQFFDRSEGLLHRAYLPAREDELAFDALKLAFPGGTGSRDGLPAEPDLEETHDRLLRDGSQRDRLRPMPRDTAAVLAAVPAPSGTDTSAGAAEEWDAWWWRESYQVDHLDAITVDSGVRRRRAMGQWGEEAAWQVDPEVLSHFLAYLAQAATPVTLGVVSPGCVQLHRGPLDLVESLGSVLTVLSGACTVAIEPPQLSECWVTRSRSVHGLASQIELYDRRRRCVAIVTQTGLLSSSEAEDWEELLASLPLA